MLQLLFILLNQLFEIDIFRIFGSLFDLALVHIFEDQFQLLLDFEGKVVLLGRAS